MQPSPPSPAAERRGEVRWRVPVALLALAAAGLAFVWLRDEAMRQNRVLMTAGILLLTGALLLGWALFASGLRRRTRARLGVATLVVVGLCVTLVEVRGVTGDFMPVLAWRFRARDDALATRVEPAASPAAAEVRAAADFPQFLGPDRDATIRGVRLARDWDARPPRIVWRREVGSGWSGFAVVGALAITQEQRGDEELVVAYDLGSGAPRWMHGEAARYDNTIGGIGPRATPAVADGHVYAVGATGVMVCLELEGGALRWRRDLPADAGGGANVWGVAGSPLVLGERVVVASGAAGGDALLAYDRRSGELVWRGRSGASAYSSPALQTFSGTEQLVILNDASVAGHDPHDGAVLWQTPWPSSGEAIAQPVRVDGDGLVVSNGYGVGAARYDVTRDADGRWRAEQRWKSLALKAKLSNFVHVDGSLYGLDDGILACVDAATGRRRWKGGRYGHGQLLRFGDLLLVVAERGELVLVELSPDELRELGSAPALDDKTWNSPAFAPPYLIVRNDLEAVCLELALEPEDPARR